MGVDLLACGVALKSVARLALFTLLPAGCHESTLRERSEPAKTASGAAATVDSMTGQQGLRTGSTPLAVRMRPTSLDEVAGQQHLLKPGSPLVNLANDATGETGSVSVILWGPPGTGKTTLAQAIAHSSGRRFVELSAVTAGVKDVRDVMEKAHADRDLYGLSTVLFLDEIHRFNKAQQDALLPGVENGWIILVAATTENPSFSVVAPLLSRSLLLTLEPLSDDDLGMLVDRAVSDPRGLNDAVTVEPDARAAHGAPVIRRRAPGAHGAGGCGQLGRGRRPPRARSPSSPPTSSPPRSTGRCCATTARATSTTTSSARSSSRSAAPTSTRRCTTSRA